MNPSNGFLLHLKTTASSLKCRRPYITQPAPAYFLPFPTGWVLWSWRARCHHCLRAFARAVSAACCLSTTQSCSTICSPMDCRPPCPCSHSCPLSQWYYLAISSFCCPLSLPASGSLPMSWLFVIRGQSIGASGSVLPMNILGWFPLGLTGLISKQSKGLSRLFSSTTIWRHQFFSAQPSLWSNSHIHTWLLEKTIALTT